RWWPSRARPLRHSARRGGGVGGGWALSVSAIPHGRITYWRGSGLHRVSPAIHEYNICLAPVAGYERSKWVRGIPLPCRRVEDHRHLSGKAKRIDLHSGLERVVRI